jgi:DNA-binding transcriptional ArsR family regulator
MNTANYDSFLAIADPHRREILKMLSKKQQSINTIAENFNISRPAVSKHIKVLYSTGFINIEDKGRERYCTLKQDGFLELQEWINYFEKYWLGQLKSLDTFLKETHSTKKNKKGGS